ncbi:TrlF family AAA-like ATPase [Candidatus Palauibacter sp.]|uniref:TrlF family AAA-like ATPase n=1 Tax=Candidatus Palauibacter sp. TaxID=3101350 RepID=UPI003B0195F8
MNGDWVWPGSRWWRLDLHIHSPVSHDVPDWGGDPDWPSWIEAARDAGLHAIAITDHNTAAAVTELHAAMEEARDPPVLFPGVELTANDGVHLILLSDRTSRQEDIEDLLSRAGVPPDARDREDARSTLSVEQILDQFGTEALVLGAHANGPKGLLAEHDGQQRLAVLKNPNLAAVEVDPSRELDESWLDGSKGEVGREIARLWSSDAHSLEEIGRRFTWVKMTRPDLEGLRLALLDGPPSLDTALRDDPVDPNSRRGELVIESITVRNARFMGRPNPVTVQFNPWLNAIIGGRGTGKSTLVDLCRKVLRRETELGRSGRGEEGSLRAHFDRRMDKPRSRGAEGLLESDTSVEVIYQKHRERFALSWSRDGTAQPICRLGADGSTPEQGGIPDRFPVRIYSQKQLFSLAQDPNALLAIIDASPTVQAAEKHREIETLRSRYLSLRAQARAAAARAEDVNAREAELSDIQRKLDYLQEGGQARHLSDYRKRKQQDDTWRAVIEAAIRDVDAVRVEASDLTVADLPAARNDSSDDSWASLEIVHEALRRAVESFKETVQAAANDTSLAIMEIVKGEDGERWREAFRTSEEAFRGASAELAERGIRDPSGYGELLAEAARITREIQTLKGEREQAKALDLEAAEALELYRKHHHELAERRQSLAGDISSDLIRVSIVPFDNTGNLEDELTSVLGIERFDADRRALARRIMPKDGPEGAWGWEDLDKLVSDIRTFLKDDSSSWPAQDGRFRGALAKVPPERIDRLALYVPGDLVQVRFKDPGKSWRPLAQGSPGQQTAALLAFVLGHGSEPIILDQPEDDLDTTLIYDLLVKQLRTTKRHRQVIVVTHNPNIVVHGDAEYVLSLEAGNGQSRVLCEGGLQERKVRDEICRVMEGGRDAFERRYRRIMPPEWPV